MPGAIKQDANAMTSLARATVYAFRKSSAEIQSAPLALEGNMRRQALQQSVLALLIVIVCLVTACPAAAAIEEADQAVQQPITYPTPESFEQAVESLLGQEQSVPLPVRQRKAALKAYYVDAAGAPIWWRNPAMQTALIEVLERAEDEGLDARDYPVGSLRELVQPDRFTFGIAADLTHAAGVELYFSAFFLKFASDLQIGRILPTKVDPRLYWRNKSTDMIAALRLISRLGSMTDFIAAWQPQVPEYAGLRHTLAAYREIAANGGWPAIEHGDVLKPGETSARVPTLRERLRIVEPELAALSDENVYDEALMAAVKRFQSSHGLSADGIVGKQTLFHLNIPVESRIRQIVLSMERWRWMPESLGENYIMVNIAGYELIHVRNGRLHDRMRVVVGRPYYQTPVFSERMTYVELNPYWYVPHSIAVKEELPKLQSQPAALAERGYEALVGDTPTSVTAIDWNKYSASNFPFRLRQKPGPRNALGLVKFMFPNQFNVYMHDTPSRGLFSETERARSHGCIRLARPLDMAEQVLTAAPGWDRKRIDAVVAGQERTVVSLKTPLDVHITYSTAWRDDDGLVHFRPDVYQRDAKLHLALFGKPSPY